VKEKKPQENVPEGCALFYKKKRWTLHNTQRATQQQEGSGGYNCSYWKGQVRNPRPREKSVINAPTAPMAAVEDIDKE